MWDYVPMMLSFLRARTMTNIFNAPHVTEPGNLCTLQFQNFQNNNKWKHVQTENTVYGLFFFQSYVYIYIIYIHIDIHLSSFAML